MSRTLLRDPLLNKDLAFTQQERDQLTLHGFLPINQVSLEEQCERAYLQFSVKPTPIEKHIYLRNLQDTNEVLFYALITHHIEEMLPIVYTPVVGEGCIQFSHIYRHPRGLFVGYPLKNKIKTLFDHRCYDGVKAIVVTDGERILGLGDQGANGMGIPIGKLSLYTACAGIHPAHTLPVMLDVGTNNPKNLGDPLYVGWHHERIRGAEYEAFIEEFVNVVIERFPHILLQWEDFAQQQANPILQTYRHKLCTFNDDIQGTAAVVAGTLFAAIQATGTSLKEQRIAVLGAGSAGCGISSLIHAAMKEEGLNDTEAYDRFFLIDQKGLLREEEKNLLNFQRPFAKNRNTYSQWKLENPSLITLSDVIHNVHPTILIGVSGQCHVFTETLIKDMHTYVDRPIIFPLSNPNSHAEAAPQDLLDWTQGKAIIGTGSPFPPVTVKGATRIVDQINNVYIFPGMGLGLIASQAKEVTDRMFMIAAKTLAANSPSKQNKNANLLPSLRDIRKVSFDIGLAVAQEALREGLSPIKNEKTLEEHVHKQVWEPKYTENG